MSKTVVTKIYSYTCPYCGKNLSLNRDMHLKEIQRLNAEITEINGQLSTNSGDGWRERFATEKEYRRWRTRAKEALKYKTGRVAELKAQRQDMHDLTEQQNDIVFRRKVKEFLGEEVYIRLREECEAENLVSYSVGAEEGGEP